MDDKPQKINNEQRNRKLMLTAGAGYGIIFGLSYALFTWGYDGSVLWLNSADMAWVKLALGLPIVVLLTGFVGFLAAYTSSLALGVILWVVVCGVLAYVAGHIPFDGVTLGVWILDQRLWGEVISPYGYSAAVRTTLIVFGSMIIGTMVGFVESISIQGAWDRATRDGRMSSGSWTVLLLCVPLALLMAVIINGFIYRPLRMPQQNVNELIQSSLSGEAENDENLQSSYRSIKPYLDQLSSDYVIHFVTFGSETGTWFSAYVDTVFKADFVLRCVTLGDTVAYCSDFSEQVDIWMDNLVRAGLYAEQPWLDDQARKLVVDPDVISWLTAHQDQLSENYDLQRDSQHGGWFFVKAKFDTGFKMTCRFHGAAPVTVNQCVTSP